MKLNIEPLPIFINGYNCMENNMNTILKWKSIDYEKSFIGSWKFKILSDENTELLGNRVYTATLAETAQRYKKYCGIDFKIHDKNTTENPFEIISGELSKYSPLLLYIDIYYCSWFEQYHKWHSGHFCTVSGIDETNVYCIDSSPIEKNGAIKRDEFEKGYKSIVTFNFNNTNSDLPDLKGVLKEIIDELGDSTFDNLRYFAGCFEKMDLKAESEGFPDIWNTPIYSSIVSVQGSRYHLQKLMEYLMKYFDEDILKQLNSQFADISNKWATIKSLTCKAIVAQDEEILTKISDRIREVTDAEEKTAQIIKNYINNDFVCKS